MRVSYSSTRKLIKAYSRKEQSGILDSPLYSVKALPKVLCSTLSSQRNHRHHPTCFYCYLETKCFPTYMSSPISLHWPRHVLLTMWLISPSDPSYEYHNQTHPKTCWLLLSKWWYLLGLIASSSTQPTKSDVNYSSLFLVSQSLHQIVQWNLPVKISWPCLILLSHTVNVLVQTLIITCPNLSQISCKRSSLPPTHFPKVTFPHIIHLVLTVVLVTHWNRGGSYCLMHKLA